MIKKKLTAMSWLLANAFLPICAQTTPTDSVKTDFGEAVVTGTRTPTDSRYLSQTVSVVSRKELVQDYRINVLPTLSEQVPGLMITNRGILGYGVSSGGSGGMMLRGLSSGAGQVMVLIDGHPQYSGIYGHSIADSYQTLMADRVEVIRGPSSLLYGSNAMGGVVNIVTRRMHQDGVQTKANVGAGSYGTVEAEVSNQVKKGRFNSTVAAQYARSDNHRDHMGEYQYGGYAKIDYEINAKWRIFADVNMMHFAASWPGTVQQPMLEADQWITRGAAAIGVENNYRHSSGRLSVYDNWGRHKINDGFQANGGTPQTRLFRSRDALAGVSWYQTMALWTDARITIGADYQHIYGRAFYTDRSSGTIIETPNKQSGHVHNNEYAVYADFSQNLWQWLSVDAGLRYDNHSAVGGTLIPQGGLTMRIVPTGELKMVVGKGFRNPTMRELYLYPPSNEELKPESMVNYELSWRHRPLQGRLNYGINVYYLHADNLIQTINRKNINTGELHNYGLEADLTWHINSNWSLTTNHSWLHMKHPIVSAPIYKGYLGANLSIGQWQLHAGLTQVADMYTATGENEAKQTFTLFNLTASYLLNRCITLWVKGDNLLGQHYEMVYGNPMPKANFMGGISVTI